MTNAVERFKGNVSTSSQQLNTLGARATLAGAAISSAFNNVNTVIGKGISKLGECHQELKLVAVSGVGKLIKSVQDAAHANQIINKFEVVFKEFTTRTHQWAKDYADTVGRSEYAMMSWLSGFQNFFYPLGYARGEAALLSQKMVKLAADLGSFNNVATGTAAEALRSFLAGNDEAAGMLGIELTDADVKMYAYQQGIAKAGSELSSIQEVQARMGLAFAKSSDAIDDATRTAHEFNNQWLRFRGNLHVISVDIGNNFLPTLRRGLVEVNKFLERLKGSEKLKKAAYFLGMGTAILTIGTAIGSVSAAYKVLGGFFTIKNFFVAGALVGLVLLIEDLWVALSGGKAVLTPVVNWIKEYGTTIKWVAGIITTFFAPAILSLAIPAMVKWISFMAFATKYHIWNLATTTWGVVSAVGGLWKALIGKGVKGIVTFGKKVGSVILKVLKLSRSLIYSATKSVVTFAGTLLKKGITSLISFKASIVTTAAKAIPTLIGGLVGAASGVWAFTAALLANPITWVVVGVIALGAAIYGLAKNWDKVTGFVRNIWGSFTSWLGNSLDKAKERFQNWGNNIKNWFADRGITLPEIKIPTLPDLSEKIKGWGASIGEKARSVWENVEKLWADKVITPPKIRVPSFPDLTEKIKNWGVTVREDVVSIWDGMKSWFEDKTGIKLPEFQLPKLPDIKDVFSTWVEHIQNFFGNLDFGSMIKGALDKALNLIPKPLRGLANKILGFLPRSPANEEPLSNMDKVGSGLRKRIGNGIEGEKDNLALSVSHNQVVQSQLFQMQKVKVPTHLQNVDQDFRLSREKLSWQIPRSEKKLHPLDFLLLGQPQGLVTNKYHDQQYINRNSSSFYNPRSQQAKVVNHADNIEIVVNGSNNPESTAKAVRKELELYFSQAHASVVGD